MATIAKLAVVLTANTAKLQKGMKSAGASLKKFEKRVGITRGQVLKFAGAMAGAAVAGMALLTKRALAQVDVLAKVSDKLGIATEDLAGLQLAAERTGVTSETMNMALQRMVRRVTEAAAGTGEAVNALKELGLSAQRLAKLSPDKQFKAIAGAMKEVKTEGDKVRLSFKLFDSEGVALKNTLALGAQGLHEMANEAKGLGLAISRVDAAKIESANDSVDRLRGLMDGVGRSFAISVSPFLEQMANFATNNAPAVLLWAGNFADILSEMATSAANVARSLGLLPEFQGRQFGPTIKLSDKLFGEKLKKAEANALQLRKDIIAAEITAAGALADRAELLSKIVRQRGFGDGEKQRLSELGKAISEENAFIRARRILLDETLKATGVDLKVIDRRVRLLEETRKMHAKVADDAKKLLDANRRANERVRLQKLRDVAIVARAEAVAKARAETDARRAQEDEINRIFERFLFPAAGLNPLERALQEQAQVRAGADPGGRSVGLGRFETVAGLRAMATDIDKDIFNQAKQQTTALKSIDGKLPAVAVSGP